MLAHQRHVQAEVMEPLYAVLSFYTGSCVSMTPKNEHWFSLIHLVSPHMVKHLQCRCVYPEWIAVIYPLRHYEPTPFFTLTKWRYTWTWHHRMWYLHMTSNSRTARSLVKLWAAARWRRHPWATSISNLRGRRRRADVKWPEDTLHKRKLVTVSRVRRTFSGDASVFVLHRWKAVFI